VYITIGSDDLLCSRVVVDAQRAESHRTGLSSLLFVKRELLPLRFDGFFDPVMSKSSKAPVKAKSTKSPITKAPIKAKAEKKAVFNL
jgi:hypothetical protein